MSSHKIFLVTVEFNWEINDVAMSQFCETCNLQDLVKDSTCYKNPSKPTLLIQSEKISLSHSFQYTQKTETS